jgi:outer membrane cobalamin receptor
MQFRTLTGGFAACAALFTVLCGGAFSARAAEITGSVIDPSGSPIAGAQVAAFTPAGVITTQITGDDGKFDIYLSPLYEGVQLRVTAAGFATTTAPLAASRIPLAIAPQTDSIRVAASAIDTPTGQQGSAVAMIGSAEIRRRNEATVTNLLRQTPGMAVSETGGPGSVATLFLRGGDSKYNLVLLNGIPVNTFYFGGLFDFAQIPADFIQQIDVVRGPASSVYGSYALSGVVSMETRAPEDGTAFDFVAEGGTHRENRFALSGSGMLWKNFGLAGSLSSYNDNGPVVNSHYRNDNGFLALTHRWRTQNVFAFGDFNSNATGEPGPFGSNPLGYYTGIDRISHAKNNTSLYGLHYQDDFADKLRLEVLSGFFLNNNEYVSPYGFSFNKDLRLTGEARGTWAVNRHWTLAGGYSFAREEFKNTYVTDSSGRNFPLRRDTQGVYLDNRITLGRFYVDAGLREEIYQTPFVPGDATAFTPRPAFAAHTDTRLNPRLAAAYLAPRGERLHASWAQGIRPPGGSDLAFTTNPALKPERVESYDFGVEQRLLRDRLSLDATWFHNRYRDLITSLGGSLAVLSHFTTDNLSNAKAQGTELSAQLRPVSWISLRGAYTWLDTELLALDGSSNLVQRYYTAGQELPRRPRHLGSALATVHYKRADIDIAGYFRGKTLDVEPSYGAFGGFFVNHGFHSVDVNLNLRVSRNVTAYARVGNALNERYEETYGFPAPLLHVVAGVKWSLAHGR